MSIEITDARGYTQLNSSRREIRLLTILPGTWDSPIHCRMHLISLDSAPLYQTLSYTWGDQPTFRRIFLDNQPTDVTTNLECALRRLRQVHARLLWVDALCINQMDTAEKSSQVQLMHDIYKSTEHVWIWLGEEDYGKNEHAAFEVINHMSSNEHLNTDISLSGFNSMVQLMQRPWWNRTWVIQESVLPPEGYFLLGGLEPFPLSKARRAAGNFFRHLASCCLEAYTRLPEATGNALMDFARALNNINNILALHEAGREEFAVKTFTDLLWTFRSRKASNPLDKVYGLLGLLDPSFTKQAIVPDYSLTSRQLFSQVVINLIESERSLNILLCDCGRVPSNNLPSWVHDWNEPLTKIQDYYGTERLGMLINYNFFNTSKSRVPVMKYLDNQILCLQGVFVDTIVNVGDCIDENTTSSLAALASVLNRWRDIFPRQEYPTGGTYQDAFWRTNFMNLFLDVQTPEQNRKMFHPRPAHPNDEKIWNFFQAYLNGVTPDPEDADYSMNHAHLNEEQISMIFRIATMGRRYFITTKGYIGLAPFTAIPGDCVYVLLGGSVPFVLRSFSTRDNDSESEYDTARHYHQLIGDCYMHGIMNGEMLDDHTSEQIDWCYLV